MSVRSSGSRAKTDIPNHFIRAVNDGTAGSKGETDMVNSHGRFVYSLPGGIETKCERGKAESAGAQGRVLNR